MRVTVVLVQDLSDARSLGERVRARRLQLGLTQQELAHQSNSAIRTITRIEAGEDARLATLVLVATALDTTVAELLTPETTEAAS